MSLFGADMDSQSIVNAVATVMCFAAMALPVIALIAYGVRSRVAYAARIRELIRSGAYASWGKPPMAGRLRLLGFFALLAPCGLLGWMALLLTNRSAALSTPALIIVSVIFLGMLVAGFTMQWLAVHPSRDKRR